MAVFTFIFILEVIYYKGVVKIMLTLMDHFLRLNVNINMTNPVQIWCQFYLRNSCQITDGQKHKCQIWVFLELYISMVHTH